MEINPLTKILQSTVTEKDGIYFSEDTKDTVWDTLAKENPTNAVISSRNEEEARVKSEPQINELLEKSSNGVFLDLGCGYGRIAKYLLPQRVQEGYVGVDSSAEMLRIFRDRYNQTPSEQRTPTLMVCSDIDSIPLEESSVDTVAVAAVFLHNHKSVVARSIKEVYRVLKPGGKLLVYSSFPKMGTPTGLQGSLYTAVLGLIGDGMRNGPVRYYSKREVKNLLSEFGDVQIIPYGFAVFPKVIIGLPSFLNNPYRVWIALPVNAFLKLLFPAPLRRVFATHHDVIAVK